jgi:hypothetical protein
VEWGEGLVEDLAPSFLQIAISADRPSVEQTGAEQTGTEQPGAGQPGGGLAGADQPTGEGDELRTVRVLGWGDRWREAAPAARQALAGRRA